MARKQVDSLTERLWVGAGWLTTYVATQVALPRIAPKLAENDNMVDLGLAVGGTVIAARDPGHWGAFAFGSAMVGALGTADRITMWVEEKVAAWQAG